MRPARGSRLRPAAVLAAALLVAATGFAELRWIEQYRRGLELEQAGSWADAAAAFYAAAAGERMPRARVRIGGDVIVGYDPHFHLARCLVELGRFGEAGRHLGGSYRAGVTPRSELDALRARIEAGVRPSPNATPLPAQLAVTSDPPGAAVEIDGVSHGATPTGALLLSPGTHQLRVVAPGFAPETRALELVSGPNAVHLALRPSVVPTAPAASPEAAPLQPQTTNPPAPPAGGGAQAESPPRESRGQAGADAGAPAATAVPTVAPLTFPTRHTPWWPLAAVAALLAGGVAWRLRREKGRGAGTSPHSTATTVLAGEPATIGGYRVLATLGRGGMATTFRAERIGNGASVALKVPHEACLTDPSFVARFVREGRLGEQLHHPRIVRIFEAGEERGRPFLAMELVAGHTLKDEIRSQGALSLRRALEIAVDIGEALDYAHAKGVIHRDLKPENVMVAPDGSIRVMDFGIARVAGEAGLTASNVFIGTPLYAAPEVAEARAIDARADLYSLGIVLFEMLQGVVPFTSESPLKVLEMQLRQALPARTELARPVPDAVWRVVCRLCEKDPAQRYPSAAPLLVELRQLLRRLGELEADGG